MKKLNKKKKLGFVGIAIVFIAVINIGLTNVSSNNAAKLSLKDLMSVNKATAEVHGDCTKNFGDCSVVWSSGTLVYPNSLW